VHVKSPTKSTMAASGSSRRDGLNVERLTFDPRGAKLPECRIGEVEWRLQIHERKTALKARDSVDDEFNIAYIHTDERKSCPQLHIGGSPP
jgi:hypothetical protein